MREFSGSGYKVSHKSRLDSRGRLTEEIFGSIASAREYVFGTPSDDGDVFIIYYRRPGAPSFIGWRDAKEQWKVVDGSPELVDKWG